MTGTVCRRARLARISGFDGPVAPVRLAISVPPANAGTRAEKEVMESGKTRGASRSWRLTRRRMMLLSLAALMTTAAAPVAVRAIAADGAITNRPAPAFPVSRLTIETARGRFDIDVEMADTWERRMWGLQHRRMLAADAGMLFDYKESRPVAMWMKNTHLPLDMLFIDAAGRVARVARDTEPLSLTPIPSGEPVRAVLELNAGTADRLGIRLGDRIRHAIFDEPAN